MIFSGTDLPGVKLIRLVCNADNRGAFQRVFCTDEFADAGIAFAVVQSSLSLNDRAGTLRGMHYQQKPFEEAKVVTCITGAIYDVVVDLRSGSPTRLQWQSFVLQEKEHTALYIPKGFAHGFLTLEDDSRVLYQINQSYHPGAARGIRYNDPVLNILWPRAISCISEKDTSYPFLSREDA